MSLSKILHSSRLKTIHKNPHSHRAVFIHIPKTGGTWITKNLLEMNFLAIPDHGYCTAELSPAIAYMRPYNECSYIFNGVFPEPPALEIDTKIIASSILSLPDYYTSALKLSVIRNPFDWLVSYWMHKGDGHDGWDDINHIHGIRGFEEFVTKYCDPNFPWHHWRFHISKLFQIFRSDSRSQLDVLFKFENLNANFKDLMVHCGFLEKNDRLPVEGKFGFINHKKKDYRSYYNDKTRELVEKRFEFYLSRFGYDFDGVTTQQQFFSPKNLTLDLPAKGLKLIEVGS